MERTSRAIEDYLEALLMLEDKGSPLEITEISLLLKVSKPAATQMMDELKDLGYISKEKYGAISLNPSGRKIAGETLHRHMVLKSLLTEIGVSEEIAEEDCCHIEHVISKESFSALEKLQLNLKNTDK